MTRGKREGQTVNRIKERKSVREAEDLQFRILKMVKAFMVSCESLENVITFKRGT